MKYRKTSQPLLPLKKSLPADAHYDIFPSFQLDTGKIFEGYDSLAQELIKHNTILIDGYGGVLWHVFIKQLQHALAPFKKTIQWIDIAACWKEDLEIFWMIGHCLNRDDSVFGKRYEGALIDFLRLKN